MRSSGRDRGPAVAAAIPGARLLLVDGGGHAPHLRDPVRYNLELRRFLATAAAGHRDRGRGRSTGPSGRCSSRRRSGSATPGATSRSPGELRKLHPDLEIDWLAQDPVTRVLEACGERIHPASAELASESGHIESESAEHDLHCFQAIRRMDEILVANFMVFHDVVTAAERYDLWIGDEAWELDYFLHENPELKPAAYCWLTDFVGWIPMPDGGEREAFLTADYQRRDDRAHRALPRAARSRHLRRQPRRHRARRLRPRPARDPRLDRVALRLRRLRDRLRPGRLATATSSAPSSATGPTRRSASSRWAARASAATLLGRVIDAFPRPSGGCPSCA